MRHTIRFDLFSLLLFSSFVCARAQQPAPADLRAAAAQGCAKVNQLAGLAPAACAPGAVERRHIVADVFEYSFQLKVGEGEHDTVGVHRVIRERANGVALRADHAVFMVHGDLWGFDEAFMSSTLSGAVPREQSLGVYLARKGLDVWGIDLRWRQVPADTADFAFMKDWNIGTHVRDIAAAIGVARSVRAATGGGDGKVTLFGWSRGGAIAYAYANEETRLPEASRQVGALIPFDIAYKLNPEHEAQRQAACTRYAAEKAALDAGVYVSPLGGGVKTFGLLAATAPSEPSPVPGFEGLTNRQAALLVGSATHLLFAPNPPAPFYHLNAATFDTATGLPTGLQFTREAYLYDFYQTAAPFQSSTEQAENDAVICGESATPYDDRLNEITIPVLYLGAGGGFGEYGLDTLSRLGSADATSRVVNLYGPEARPVEFGHADLLMADDAKDLVWSPLYDWLVSH
jgi:pimeloyl-ACP methyl ester carboxylesterase